MDVRIEQSWKKALKDEFSKPYFTSLVQYLHKEKAEGRQIFPPGGEIFKAFELTPVDKVKVGILGQDPYHGAGQAMGLSFSVPADVPAPPSLKNIFKEIESDLGIKMSDGVVFLLWGNFARSKKALIDTSRHHVLEAAHPSPLARGAFFGCRHFSKTNEILMSEGKSPIDWQI